MKTSVGGEQTNSIITRLLPSDSDSALFECGEPTSQ